jgi:predicted dehydrogenase
MPNRNNPQESVTTNRRAFLKTSGTVFGGALAGGMSIGRTAHAAGSDVLKIGLIGCGGRGTGAAVNAMTVDENTQLTALADPFAEKMEGSLEGLKKRFGERVTADKSTCFDGFDGYQKVIDSGVDVVILGTPPHFRPMHLKAAVDAKLHVFCEKPVAVDAPGVRSVLETSEEAEKKGLCLVSGLCWRYHFGVQETMKRVLDGAIGDVVSVLETYNTGHVGRSQPRKPEWSEMEFQLRNWYFFTWLSGDHNVEQHVHSLDKASWVMGDRPPKRAWGLGGRQVKEDPKYGDIFDHHAVVYEYDSGARVFAYCRQQPGCWNSTEDYFYGTKGTCNVLNKYRIDAEKRWRYDGPNCNMYEEEHRALFSAIRSGDPINNGRYMSISTMLAIIGRMVTYTGQAIEWDKAMQSQETLAPASYSWDADPPTMPGDGGQYQVAIPGSTKFV